VTALKRRFKEKYPSEDIENWGKKQEVITKFAGLRKTFNRLPTVAHKKWDIFNVDLADLGKYKKWNKGIRYFCIVVDGLTRFSWVFKLRSKKPEEVVKQMGFLFKKAKPRVIFSDFGGEFRGKIYKDFLKKNNIEDWKAKNTPKASLAERKLLDVKRKLEKYMFHKKTKVWIDVIEKIIHGINMTYNRNLGFAPIDIKTKEDERLAFINLYGKKIGSVTPVPVYKPGAKFRIAHIHPLFKKSYLQNYSSELYTLTKNVARDGTNLLVLEGEDKEEVIGRFYDKQVKQVL